MKNTIQSISSCGFLICCTAALLAKFSISDPDAPLVVMDRQYYITTQQDFFNSINSLQLQTDYLYNLAINNFQSLTLDLSTLYNNLETIRVSSPSINDTAYDLVVSSESLVYDLMTQDIPTYKSQLSDQHDIVNNAINIASNSFPVAVLDTNLTLVVNVLVTNNFDFASNMLHNAENSYTNFLNYYKGIEDDLLDQYRNTVTNLLDWSEFSNWLNYTRWNTGTYAYNSTYPPIYFNYSWPQLYRLTAGLIFPLSGDQRTWRQYMYTLPSEATYSDFVAFSLIGIHDAAQQIGKDLVTMRELILLASTNTVYSFANASNTTAAIGRANLVRQSVGSFENNVVTITQSRNWFQRLELWLASIAFNTERDYADVQESFNSSSEMNDQMESISNDVYTATSGLSTSFRGLGDLTNTLIGVQTSVDSVKLVLNSFKSGNTSRPSEFRLMPTDFISDTFGRLQVDPDGDMSLPSYIGSDVNTPGFSDTLTFVDWVHHIFGFIWVVLGLALMVYYAKWISQWVVTLWYRLLGFLARVITFTWGNS